MLVHRPSYWILACYFSYQLLFYIINVLFACTSIRSPVRMAVCCLCELDQVRLTVWCLYELDQVRLTVCCLCELDQLRLTVCCLRKLHQVRLTLMFVCKLHQVRLTVWYLCEVDQVRLLVWCVWTWSDEIVSVFVWTWPGEVNSVMFVWTWPGEVNSVMFVWTWPGERSTVPQRAAARGLPQGCTACPTGLCPLHHSERQHWRMPALCCVQRHVSRLWNGHELGGFCCEHHHTAALTLCYSLCLSATLLHQKPAWTIVLFSGWPCAVQSPSQSSSPLTRPI